MATPPNAQLLFAGVPNELGIAILRQFDFYDLISAFFVSSLWAKTINKDDVMRAKMFRLPQGFKKKETERTQNFIDSLWEKVYDKTDEDEDLWDNIDINPFFDNDKRACTGKQGAYQMKSHRAFDTSRLAKVSARHHQLHQQLCGSMLLTYPPVQYTKNGIEPPRPWAPRVHGWLELELAPIFFHIGVADENGVTIKELFDYIQGKAGAWEQRFPVPKASRLKSRHVWLIAPMDDSGET